MFLAQPFRPIRIAPEYRTGKFGGFVSQNTFSPGAELRGLAYRTPRSFKTPDPQEVPACCCR